MQKCASPLVAVSSIFQKWWTFLKATWIDWKYFRWTWWIPLMLGFGQSPFQLSVKVNMMHHERLVLVHCQKLGMWQWSAENTYLDLAASAADATEHFRDRGDHGLEELFWSQFDNPERPLSVSDRLAAWAELNRLSGLAMRYVASCLWPEKPEPKSYFGLVQQFLGSVSHADAMKRSACIEGAQMALAHVKTY